MRTRSIDIIAISALSLLSMSCRGEIDSRRFDGATVGRIGVELAIVTPSDVDEIRYRLVGPGGFLQDGAFAIATPGMARARLVLPVGRGYQLTLSTTSSDGGACTGAAAFDVARDHTTPVHVQMRCPNDTRYGSVLLTGALNRCPSIDSVIATPSEAGSRSFALTSRVTDDGEPFALQQSWRASSGSIAMGKDPSATLSCATPGVVHVSLDVSDGDHGCAATRALLDLTCPTQIIQDASVGSGPARDGGELHDAAVLADAGAIVDASATAVDPPPPHMVDAGVITDDDDAGAGSECVEPTGSSTRHGAQRGYARCRSE